MVYPLLSTYNDARFSDRGLGHYNAILSSSNHIQLVGQQQLFFRGWRERGEGRERLNFSDFYSNCAWKTIN